MKKLLFIILIITYVMFAGASSLVSPVHAFTFGNPDNIKYRPLRFELPKAERLVLNNGIILFIFEDHEIPLVNVNVLIRSGLIYDPQGKEGLADITARVMRIGGTKTMRGDEVDNALEQFAGTIDVSMAADHGTASLSVLKKDLHAGFDIFSQIIKEPAFEDAKLKLAADLKKEELRRIKDDPMGYARREFNRLIYRNHPRGKLPTVNSIKTIRRDHLLEFHRTNFFPKNIMMAISGDITKQEVLNLMNRYFGNWDKPGIIPTTPSVVKKQKGGLFFVHKDIPQSVILLGHPAPGKKDAKSYAFSIFDFIVGSGGFSSRIFQEVRTNEGLAYSAGSFYRGRPDDGMFGAYAFTKSSSTATVLARLKSILKEADNKGITQKELSWAKKSIDNSFIFSFLSGAQIAYQQMKIEYDKLPEDYLSSYRYKIENVKNEELQSVVRKYIDHDEPVILVLGNEEAYRQLISVFKNIEKIEGAL